MSGGKSLLPKNSTWPTVASVTMKPPYFWEPWIEYGATESTTAATTAMAIFQRRVTLSLRPAKNALPSSGQRRASRKMGGK